MNLDARRLTSKGFSCLGTESHVLQRLIALYAGLQLHASSLNLALHLLASMCSSIWHKRGFVSRDVHLN